MVERTLDAANILLVRRIDMTIRDDLEGSRMRAAAE
jgi:hypothetical protein